MSDLKTFTQYPRIIITGSEGWLGKRLVEVLSQYHTHISCLVFNSQEIERLEKLNVEIIIGDVCNKASLRALFQNAAGGLVIHCAGVIHPKYRTKYFYDINVQGTKNLYELAHEHQIARFVAMSSNSVLGNNPYPSHSFTEEDPYNPYMCYGDSKFQMETMLQSRAKHRPEIVIIRAPWFYGPGQPQRQNLFFKMVKEGKFPLFGQGLNRRSMVYIDNLVDGIIKASLHADAANEIFWIADEKPYTMLEIIATIKAIFKEDFNINTSAKNVYLPNWVGTIAEKIDGSLQSCGFYHQKMHVLSEMNKTIACDINKAKKILGYAPPIALREGMKNSIMWCLDNGVVFDKD